MFRRTEPGDLVGAVVATGERKSFRERYLDGHLVPLDLCTSPRVVCRIDQWLNDNNGGRYHWVTKLVS